MYNPSLPDRAETTAEDRMADMLIEITEPQTAPRTVRLTDGLTIGRNDDNACVLGDPKVSGYHAKIHAQGAAFAIEDLGSSNGTKLQGGRLLAKGERLALAVGMKLELGFTMIEVKPAPAVAKTSLLEVPAAPPEAPKKAERPADAPPPRKAEKAAKAPAPPAAPESSEARTSHSMPVPSLLDGIGDEKTAGRRAVDEDISDLERTTSGVPVIPVEPGHAHPPATAAAAAKPAAPAPPPARKAPESDSEGAAPTVISRPIKRDDVKKAEAAAAAAKAKAAPPPRAAVPGPDPEQQTIQSKPKKREAEAAPSAAAKKSDSQIGNEEDTKIKESTGVPDRRPSKPNEQETIALSLGADSDVAMSSVPRSDADVLAKMRARLVFEDPKFRAAVALVRPQFTIGRKRSSVKNDVDFEIDHPTVSTRHAVIKLQGRHFILEDLGAKNMTFVDGRMIPIMREKEIRPDSTVRFGVVDALFVVDCDRDLKPLARESLYSRAVDYLVAKGIVKAKQKAAIARGEHPGEKLILEGACSVAQWAQALKAIESSGFVGAAKTGLGNMRLMISIGVMLVIACLLVFVLKREWFQ